MHFGSDFFNWMGFVMAVIRLFVKIFGDPDEQEQAKNNHVDS